MGRKGDLGGRTRRHKPTQLEQRQEMDRNPPRLMLHFHLSSILHDDCTVSGGHQRRVRD